MTAFLDFTAPDGVRTRGTVLVLPGRGESLVSYARFGARLAADAYRVTGLAEALPAARLAVVRGAHHDVLNDLQHRSVAAEVVSFLEAVRAGSPLRPLVEVAA